MREVFDKYDDNESGKLDHKELLSAIKDLGLAGDTERAKDLLMSVDKDMSGLMEFDEFVQVCKKLNQEGELKVATGRARANSP